MMRIGLILLNLDRDGARLAHMTCELARLGFAFERFSAVQGLAVPDWMRERFFDAQGHATNTLKPGEIGVYASHLSIHRALLERTDLDGFLVMEDDLKLDEDLPNVLDAIARLKVSFDVLKLSNPPKAPCLDHGSLCAGRSLVTYARVPNNLGAYVITKSGAAKTIASRGHVRFAIDEDMRRPWDWELETFGVVPPPVRANVFEASSIDAMGDRQLGRESAWQKLSRRRWDGPSGLIRQVRWQIRHLGASGYAVALLLTLRHSLAKRFKARFATGGVLMPGKRLV
ncbi:COG3306 Glycosyltransferase involved in LPS biosynthesis [Rhabdaerophilaceae bacterium]